MIMATQPHLHGQAEPMAHLPTTPASRLGVNVAGFFASEKGVGQAVRSDIYSLEEAGIPYTLNNYVDPGSLNNDASLANFSVSNPHPVNLLHINANQLLQFRQRHGQAYFENRYNIGFWAWELSEFPEEWFGSFECLHEVWVPSTFALDSISRISPIPVVRVPHAIKTTPEIPKIGRSHFGFTNQQFVFLFMFDFHSVAERKNPIGLIQAFQKAFHPKEKTLLVVKCAHAEQHQREMAKLRQAAEGANVRIMDAVLRREEVDALLTVADCYVSLHRSEGFGLALAEAMNLAKPVIGTAYSGNIDFMTPANSFLVNHRLVELEQDHGPYRKGLCWADPDLDHAAQQMRLVRENPILAQRVGRQAQQDIRTHFSPQVIGRIMKARIWQVRGVAPQIGANPTAIELRSTEALKDAVLGQPISLNMAETNGQTHQPNRAQVTLNSLSGGMESELSQMRLELTAQAAKLEQTYRALQEVLKSEAKLQLSFQDLHRELLADQQKTKWSLERPKTAQQPCVADVSAGSSSHPVDTSKVTSDSYNQMILRLHKATCDLVPPDVTILVVSKGDQKLIQFEHRRGWHFPRNSDGSYTGYYPADSVAAIRHLEALRAEGANYLAFPATASWWLEYYPELREHLRARYRELLRDGDTGILFDLSGPEPHQTSEPAPLKKSVPCKSWQRIMSSLTDI
jgi:glycosyltransferase involved in cell wall biosynthesis